jgi:hypothetical protein
VRARPSIDAVGKLLGWTESIPVMCLQIALPFLICFVCASRVLNIWITFLAASYILPTLVLGEAARNKYHSAARHCVRLFPQQPSKNVKWDRTKAEKRIFVNLVEVVEKLKKQRWKVVGFPVQKDIFM